MLTVGYKEKNLEQYDMNFHIGSGRIRQTVEEEFSVDEIAVHADGHELEVIREQFSNIPMTANRVVCWTGETARFIVENIKL